jgi:hypothetical protein
MLEQFVACGVVVKDEIIKRFRSRNSLTLFMVRC